METIKQVLMRRDGMDECQAEALIEEARQDLLDRLEEGEMPFDICHEWFGLEGDYIIDLLPI